MESSKQDLNTKIKLAAVESAPAFLNKSATTEKVCCLILEAGSNGADVIGFPEGFIPGHPGWVEILPLSVEPAPSLFLELFKQAVEVPGAETKAIGAACKEANIYAVVGINERRPNTTGTLFNTQLFFGRDGTLLHKHQKYVPTVGERLIHALGETGSKASVATDFGSLSSLICGENGNPLAQYSLSLDYPVVHVASWPPHFCPGSDVQDAALVTTRSLATSLMCYIINSIAIVGDDVIEKYGVNNAATRFLREEQKKRGATIIAPGGIILAGPFEGDKEGILYAEVNTDDLIRGKYALDYAGHYNRPEIFAHHFKRYFS
ncbi:nitrilase/cyanide hydratase and apolipo protein N-acyltransferase [Tricladium varicosporioides]|nr:nitrilase/cyanide hydratase and apolipo protein N-acyltransferase [Hymenoscyphus varicosporioides]